MNRPIIENSDRGITLNKQLAWTMLVALIGAVWWGGSTITQLQAATTSLAQLIQDERIAGTAIEGRVRSLETSQTRQDERYLSMQASLNELKAQAKETNELLRAIAERNGGAPN